MQRMIQAACGVALVLFAGAALAVNIDVNLDALLDQYGNQIEVIQTIETGSGPQTTFGIYDTGASVVLFSANDQILFDLLGNPIPIECAGCASAEAIGGTLIGDIGAPRTIKADGLGSLTISNSGGFPTFTIDDSNAAVVPNIKSFVGTDPTVPIPSIVGTPIHKSGKAAHINMQGFGLDLGALFPELPEFAGIEIFMPDIKFVDPGTTAVAPAAGTVTAPARIPLELLGPDNYADPGADVTSVSNPVHTHTGLAHGALSVSDQTFLFDTGAQLSILSTEIFDALGLGSETPFASIEVQGAAGTEFIDGYIIDALSLALDDNGDGVPDGTITFNDVPIFVLDLPAGLDGILGMNLFNTATEMLYDPFDPNGESLTVAFDLDPLRENPLEALEGLSAEADLIVSLLSAFVPALGGIVTPNLPGPFPTSNDGPEPPGAVAVPEPSTFAMTALVIVAAAGRRRRR